jgi:hypothetical protein
MDENNFLVIKKKYEARQIKDMSDAEILTEAVKTFQRIHVITGWNLPDDNEYIKILSEEFCLKLNDEFSRDRLCVQEKRNWYKRLG